MKAEAYNNSDGYLKGINCPVCRNRGDVMLYNEKGETYLRECKCAAQRRSEALIRKSGLSEMLERYTFENWQEIKPWQAKIKKSALEFAEKGEGWLMASGRPGTGKTHICTAICSELMKKGLETRYLIWRDFSVKAKALVTDKEGYENEILPYKRCKVLYIDDFFKSARGANPSDGDINLAVELINARYNDKSLITIISSELVRETLLNIDEALGSRIIERCGSYYWDLSRCSNWRLSAANGDKT